MTKMKVIVCAEPGKMQYEERPIPVPGTTDVLLRVKRIGVCGTDLHAFSGRQPYFEYPRILGHEISAEIADPNGYGFRVGEPVTIMPYFYCGHCYSCRIGKTNCCSRLKVAGVHIDGAMQEYFAAPASSIISNTNMSTEDLALIEPFAIGSHALSRAGIKGEEQVLILGAGPIGIGLVLLAISKGIKVILADIDDERLKICRTIPGLQVVNSKKENLQDAVMAITGSDGVSTVFEATGNLAAIESALPLISFGGQIVLVGIQKEAFHFSHPDFHRKETTLMSSRNATHKDFEDVIHFFQNNGLGIFPYISDNISFNDAADWFMDKSISKNKNIKAMIRFDV
ncbi:zinc-binding alcohol dehydrogenase family protein [Pollutibacter soli]|uniref:zinc-binding alcohol dehydrogenase family protein n=1 Tax=Pollutibacter soli TaxID=3034157 RepID=UPI00301363B0